MFQNGHRAASLFLCHPLFFIHEYASGVEPEMCLSRHYVPGKPTVKVPYHDSRQGAFLVEPAAKELWRGVVLPELEKWVP